MIVEVLLDFRPLNTVFHIGLSKWVQVTDQSFKLVKRRNKIQYFIDRVLDNLFGRLGLGKLYVLLFHALLPLLLF